MSAVATTRRRLTAVIMVRDPGPCADRSVASVATLADEVLIANCSGNPFESTLRPANSTLIDYSPDDPAGAKNDALTRSTGDWVLYLEAGEILHPESIEAIQTWLATTADRRVSYFCWIESPPALPDQSGEQFAAPRILPKHLGISFEGRVRETVLPSLEKHRLPGEVVPWRILAPAADADANRVAKAAERKLRLADLDVRQFGNSPRALIASAEAHADLGDSTRAIQHYYQALRLADRGSLDMLSAYYGLLATFRGDESDRGQQLAVCLEALETYPYDAQLLCAMGAYLEQQDHLELACRSFQAAFEIGQVEPRAPHLKDLPIIAAISWSLILQLRGDRALEVIQRASERFPTSQKLMHRQLELLVQLACEADALSIATRVVDKEASVEPLRIGIRGACLAAQGNWVPALTYLRTAYEAGCHDAICLRWLTIGLAALGQIDAARPVLKMWRTVAPSDIEAARYERELDTRAGGEIAKKKTSGRSLRIDQPAPPPAISRPSPIPCPLPVNP